MTADGRVAGEALEAVAAGGRPVRRGRVSIVVVKPPSSNRGIGRTTILPYRPAMLSGNRVMYHWGIQSEAN